nr:iron ABC transporter permease [Dactylosporangium thailandense]
MNILQRRRSWSTAPVASLIGIILLLLVVVPMGTLLVAAFTDTPPRPGAPLGNFTLDNLTAIFTGASRSAFINTLIIGVCASLLALAIGSSLAWIAARTDVPLRGVVQVAAIMPMFTSSLVGALAWSMLGSPRQGYLNVILRSIGLPDFINVYSLPGIIFVAGIYYSPYAFLLVNAALTLMNPELEEAAYVHGARFRNVIGSVTLRLVMPALLGAGTLIAVMITENFPIPQILGSPYGIQTMPTQIYRLMANAPSRPNEASAAGAGLLVLTGVMVYLQRRLLAGREFTTVSGKGFTPRRQKLGAWRWPAFLLAAVYAVLAVGLPTWALLQGAFRRSSFTRDAKVLFDPASFTTRTFNEVLLSAHLRDVLLNSLMIGAGTAVIGGGVYLLIAYYVHRIKGPGHKVFPYVAMWPAAVPALVIGLGYLWTWSRVTAIYGTLAILIIGFIGHLLPQGFQSVSSSLTQVHSELEESAQVSGASRLRAAWEILVPLIRTGVVSTMLLLFILSMREISVAIFLFTSKTEPLSIATYNTWETGRIAPVAAMSLIYVAVLVVLTLISRRWFGMKTERST